VFHRVTRRSVLLVTRADGTVLYCARVLAFASILSLGCVEGTEPARATKLEVVQQPAASTAGAALAPAFVVAVQDENGNTFTSSTALITVVLATIPPGGATLSGTMSVAAVDGIATFTNLSIDKVFSGYGLIATSPGLLSTMTGVFAVVPAGGASLEFTAPINSPVAGGGLGPFVDIMLRDAFGNQSASTAPVTIAIGANGGGGTLSGTTTVNAVNGVARFQTLSIDKAGAGYTLVASSGNLPSVTSSSFTVYP
jgi:hypothetical protein